MIVKIQVVFYVDSQKFNTVFIPYGATLELNFQVLFRAQD